jgi:hypothetical protein
MTDVSDRTAQHIGFLRGLRQIRQRTLVDDLVHYHRW